MAVPDVTPATAPAPAVENERKRIAALRRFGILDTEPDPAFDEIARLAAAICQTPIALISFVDETRQWFKSRVGFDSAQTPRAQSFCAHLLDQRDIVTIPDARRDVRFRGNPLVEGGPMFRFYAGAPLISPEGHGLGMLCVIDRQPRAKLPDQQAEALRTLSRAVMAQMELRQRTAFAAVPKGSEIPAVLERVSDAVVALDRVWRYTYLNAQAGRLFARHPRDLIGKHIWTEFPDGVGQKFHLAYEKALADQQPASIEEYYPPFDRWFENRIYPSPEGLTIYFHDITARKQAELLLAGQVQVLESISQGAPLAESLTLLVRFIEGQAAGLIASVLFLDPDGKHLRHGAAPGLPEEYLRAIDGAAIGPCAGSCGTAAYLREPVFVHEIAGDPRWAEWASLAERHGLRACWSTPIFDAKQRVLGTFAIYYRRPASPTPRHLELIATATRVAAIAIGQHRSQASLRAREQELSVIFDHAREVLFFVTVALDGDLHFAAVNRQFLTATGLTESQVIGQRVAAVIPAPARSFVLEKYGEAIRTRQPVSWDEVSEYPAGRKHGVVTLVPVYETAGRVTHLVGAVHDITDRVRSEQEIREVSEQRRALAVHLQFVREEERTAIAREIHDALAQDLTRVKIDLAWLAQRVGRPIPVAKRPEIVARLAETLAQTDASITTVQKIATELRPIILDRLGLAAAIEWLVEEFSRRTGIAGLARVGSAFPGIETARATAVFRIVQESLTNIARYARASAIEIDLGVESATLSLTIRDNGVGITAAQVDDKRSIGLIGMRERAMAFGGSVEISGVLGKGTTIMVRMPVGGP